MFRPILSAPALAFAYHHHAIVECMTNNNEHCHKRQHRSLFPSNISVSLLATILEGTEFNGIAGSKMQLRHDRSCDKLTVKVCKTKGVVMEGCFRDVKRSILEAEPISFGRARNDVTVVIRN